MPKLETLKVQQLFWYYVIKTLKQNIYEAGNMVPDIVSESVKGLEQSKEEQEESKKQLLHAESKPNPNVYIP